MLRHYKIGKQLHYGWCWRSIITTHVAHYPVHIDWRDVNTSKMQQVDAELKSFFEYCRQVGFDDDELAEICRPLYGFTRKNCFKKWLIVLCVLISLVLGLYALSSVESLQWHTSAIGRILMIKLLPFWDWTTLFYKRCLIERKQLVVEDQIPLSLADCDMCESIGKNIFTLNKYIIFFCIFLFLNMCHMWCLKYYF